MSTPSKTLSQALGFHHKGDLDAAARCYAAVIAEQPQNAYALHLFGMLRHQQGDRAEACRLLDLALTLQPERPAMLANRAAVRLAGGEFSFAETDARQASRLDPDSVGAWMNLGLALDGLKRPAEAVSAFARAAALRPQDARIMLAWFSAAARSGQTAGLAERSRNRPPTLAGELDLALRTAHELEQHGCSNQAFYLLAQLRSELPANTDVRDRHAIEVRYRQACQLEQREGALAALQAADALLAVAPGHRGARMLRASLLSERGEPGPAVLEYQRIVEQVPDDAIAGSAGLIALQHDPHIDADTLALAHRTWADRHMPAINADWPKSLPHADPERPLRIGWLSPRFFSGLVETFFLPALERFDRHRARHYLYDSSGVDDATTARFRTAADVWRDGAGLDDTALCAQIRDDGIDILVELSGHGPGNRLRALAARPAPVQVSWLDYFHSTGTRAIDVLLSDKVLSPPEFARHYTEHVLTLPMGRLCYAAPEDAPPVALRGNEPVRFGCFNRLAKINDAVLLAWARILGEVPASVLKLKARAFDDPGLRSHFLSRCALWGIDREQLELTGYGSHAETLAAYADIDIALDPFPFSGCATSCDALWMGVPVVTCYAQTMVSRQTASLLTSIGLTQLVCADIDSYVQCAKALAADVALRRELRATLRQRVAAGFGDVGRHAIDLNEALREAWHRWCRG